MKEKMPQKLDAFTLVELVVVIAILALLAVISVAGLGAALRGSRNVTRVAQISNLDKAFAAYYADNQKYPNDSVDIEKLATTELEPYLEGTWDPGSLPGNTYIIYCSTLCDGQALAYSICVNQEDRGTNANGVGDYRYECLGPGVGQDNFPADHEVSVEDAPPPGVQWTNVTGTE